MMSDCKEETIYFVEEFFRDLGSSVIKSNLFRQYITMDIYFCVAEFLDGLQIPREEIEDFDIASGILQTQDSAMEYVIRIMKKALELREKSASNRYGDVVDEVTRYIEENYADEEIYTTGFVDNSMLEYTITSVTDSNGWVNSIILNGREYSKDTKGINIVVYSNETHRILDTVSFDAYKKDMSVNRE